MKERLAKTLRAPVDGKPIYLGFQSTEVDIPSIAQQVYFHFVFEPPHGDGCFQLLFRSAVFRGYIWGTNTYWSPNGRMLVAEWTGPFDERIGRTVVIIDLLSWQWIEARGFQVMSIDDYGIYGKDVGGNVASMDFSQQVDWNAA